VDSIVAYEILFAESVRAHLGALTAGQRSAVLSAIERQLGNEPMKETRSRKPLRPNPVAPWELRVGALRVFYEVTELPAPTVRILAVGIKDRATLRIGGEEIKL
jgi:mRNA-degrading endonuclease RelE of RelBE toxin-antitoxin system